MAKSTGTKFHIANGMGDSLHAPSVEEMRTFLQGIDVTDEEHGAAWLSTDGDDVLEWNWEGRMVYDRHQIGVRHLSNMTRETALDLWVALAEGHFDDLERHPWEVGNGYVETPEHRAEMAAAQLKWDREFYDLLGTCMDRAAQCFPASRVQEQRCELQKLSSGRWSDYRGPPTHPARLIFWAGVPA